mmetsp:Transcript_98397/g.306103  ORF Transcript_98397/g.306103 Transcript_98397/m.306103 type:complete len:320 (-) Transcript_98397:35-994(-)
MAPLRTSFQVSGSRVVIVGTTAVRWSPARFICLKKASSQPSRGLTWQSKKTMTSPLAASPPVFFAEMRPSVRSCRMILTGGLPGPPARSRSGNTVRNGGLLPSSTTMISFMRLFFVCSQMASTVFSAKFPSKAQGRTMLIVSSSAGASGGPLAAIGRQRRAASCSTFRAPCCLPGTGAGAGPAEPLSAGRSPASSVRATGSRPADCGGQRRCPGSAACNSQRRAVLRSKKANTTDRVNERLMRGTAAATTAPTAPATRTSGRPSRPPWGCNAITSNGSKAAGRQRSRQAAGDASGHSPARALPRSCRFMARWYCGQAML